jgi:tRNA-dihydrouridine synthase
MNKNFWLDLPKPFFALAPMESVTDVVFRHVIATAAKPDIFFTEFVNASSFCSHKGVHSTKGRLTFTDDEQPIIAQIWGKNPSEFEIMSLEMAKMGFAGIDINMGCPDKAVVRTGSGSALIRTPELAGQLIAAAKKSGLPVSVKTRIGDLKPDEWHGWLKFLLEQDIVNLTVHLRTRKEMSKVPAHYELIPEIKELREGIAPQTLLTINGDITDRQQGIELAEKYGIDGVMIGRGVFTNPYAFEIEPTEHSRGELINLLRLQLDLHDKYSAEIEIRKFDPLKRFFKIYVRNFHGASELRDKLMHTKNTDEAREIINSLGEINATQE